MIKNNQKNCAAKLFRQHRFFNLAIIFVCSTVGFADDLNRTYGNQMADSAKFVGSFVNDFNLTYHNTTAFIESPAHYQLHDWLWAAAALGAVAIAAPFDQQVQQYAQSHQSIRADHLISPWQYYGGAPGVGLTGGIYLTGVVFSNSWVRETGREALVALAISGLTGSIIKSTVGRARPYTNKSSSYFHSFTLNDDFLSFPSGHTTTAFAISSVLASRIGNPWASAGLYTLAFLTATQRIYSNNHWLSDVVLGAAIGTGVGNYIIHDSQDYLKKSSTVRITPVIGSSQIGLALCMPF